MRAAFGRVAEAQSIGHARGDCDDALDRTADLATDDIGVRVDAEPRCHQNLLHRAGRLGFGQGDDGGGRLPGRDLSSDVGSGEHPDPGWIVTMQHIAEHLCRALERCLLDALGEADDRKVRSNKRLRLLHQRSQVLRRHSGDHCLGLSQRVVQRGGAPEAIGEVDPAEEDLVLVAPVDVIDDLGLERPQGHVGIVRCEQHNRRAPRAGSYHGQPHETAAKDRSTSSQ